MVEKFLHSLRSEHNAFYEKCLAGGCAAVSCRVE